MWSNDVVTNNSSRIIQSCSAECEELRSFIRAIGEALGTAEVGRDLIEVAKNAHKTEQRLGDLIKMLETSREAKDIIKGIDNPR